MRRFVVVFGVLLVGVLISACGGDKSSSNADAFNSPWKKVQPASEEVKHPRPMQEQKREERIDRENRKFREDEERRIREEEKKNEDGERALKKPKPAKPKSKPQPAPPSSKADPIAVETYEYFTGTDLQNWELAYGVCAVTPEKQMAKEFHTEQNWAAIGHAYGKAYTEPFNIAPEEGCMSALKDTEVQREAMFTLMEEHE